MDKQPTMVIVSSGGSGANRLDDAAKAKGWDCRIVDVNDPTIVALVEESDYVLYRISPRSYPVYCAIVDRLSLTKKAKLQGALDAFDKIKTHDRLLKNNVPSPRSWIIDQSASYSGTPFVVKVPNGNQGQGVALMKNDDDLKRFFNEFSSSQYLAQEYIAMESASDKRLFVIGDKVVAAMKRQSSGDDFRSNIHLGAKAQVYVPTDQEIAIAIKASQSFGLDFSGVDIIDHDQTPLVLEVNPSPGFVVGEVAEVDLAAAIIEHLSHQSVKIEERR